jgi:hypothetical protein
VGGSSASQNHQCLHLLPLVSRLTKEATVTTTPILAGLCTAFDHSAATVK